MVWAGLAIRGPSTVNPRSFRPRSLSLRRSGCRAEPHEHCPAATRCHDRSRAQVPWREQRAAPVLRSSPSELCPGMQDPVPPRGRGDSMSKQTDLVMIRLGWPCGRGNATDTRSGRPVGPSERCGEPAHLDPADRTARPRADRPWISSVGDAYDNALMESGNGL
jgi:hypothetical protein